MHRLREGAILLGTLLGDIIGVGILTFLAIAVLSLMVTSAAAPSTFSMTT